MPNYSDYRIGSGIRPVFTNTNYTAKSNDAIWVDASGGPITITLPVSPLVGTAVRVSDSEGIAETTNITVARNGNTITGLSEDLILDVNYASCDLIWTGTTWKITVLSAGGGLTEEDIELLVSDTSREYDKQQYFGEAALTDAANISWDLNVAQTARVTLEGNRTLDNPTNMQAGATYILRVIQDGDGSRTLAFGNAYHASGGTLPTLTTTANAVDILTFYCDGTNMITTINTDVKAP